VVRPLPRLRGRERERAVGSGCHTALKKAALLAGIGIDFHHCARNGRTADGLAANRKCRRLDTAIGRAGVGDAADTIAKYAVLAPGVADHVGAIGANAVADIRIERVVCDDTVMRPPLRVSR